MDEKQLVDSLSDALKAGGFARVQRQESSRSVTLSAQKGQRTVVVHIADPEPAAGPRFAVNPDVPAASEIGTRARVPSLEAVSGSGGGKPTSKRRARGDR